ncbi:MAG: DUF4954 family protein [Prevotella sp.]|nr:DUF4954 family protein [Bacteroides sp.]MCM1366764.1 DUF4954 family protein [Prevotella sp.]MCM1437383.1 DUF4954 family protein [Prevotella sp.]
MIRTATNNLRELSQEEITQLKNQGCSADDWSKVLVSDNTDLSLIQDTDFEGDIKIGSLNRACGHRCGIKHARIIDCTLMDNILIHNIGREIRGATVESDVVIENVAAIIFEPEAPCGAGVTAAVLDETGTRPVKLYPDLNAQIATLMALKPRWAEDNLFPLIDDIIDENPISHSIGEGAVIQDCGILLNVHVDPGVTIEGARRLANGAIFNNADSNRPFSYIGYGVDAENFIIVDGKADSGAILRNTFIGQGAILEKGFTSHDSVFFANCSLENGEACAVFAGPYTVSMHKSTLLIGCMLSFMNAGSGTNQSNHMYKLGPVHWGILERGVKTSSFSYIMLGAKIAPFSLVMGSHKNHPDSSEFPFSYLFGDDKGATTVVPGMMLRSCGLLRDEKKWPTRDRRLKRKLTFLDRINFAVLNPMTIGRTLDALELLRDLIMRPAEDDGFIRYKGMKLRRAHLQRAETIYTEAICKYLYERIADKPFPSKTAEKAEEWIDLGGQLITRSKLKNILREDSVENINKMLNDAFDDFEADEIKWIGNRFSDEWRARSNELRAGAEAFDRHVEEDRMMYRDNLTAEHSMLAL